MLLRSFYDNLWEKLSGSVNLLCRDYPSTRAHLIDLVCYFQGCDRPRPEKTLVNRLRLLNCQQRDKVPVSDSGHISTVLRGDLSCYTYFFLLFLYMRETDSGWSRTCAVIISQSCVYYTTFTIGNS